jgi:hypothetical protein
VTAIRIQVTADDVAAAQAKQTDPIEVALTRITGVATMVDRDVPDGYMATIGATTPGITLVANLADEATAYLNSWWEGPGDGTTETEPIAFAIDLPDWLVDFFRSAE